MALEKPMASEKPSRGSIPSSQFQGILDKRIKTKIALEEWVLNEFQYQANQHENEAIPKHTRFLLVDTVLLRPNKAISLIWYEITDDNIWVVISQPLLYKLDQNLLNLFLKLIMDTLDILIKNKDNISVQEAEVNAFNNYVSDMERIRANRALQLAEKLKQLIFILTQQLYRQGIPSVQPSLKIPKSDNVLRENLAQSFIRVKNKLYNFQSSQFASSVRFRIIPYLFQDIIEEKKPPLRIKAIQSIQIKDASNRNQFCIVLITTQFLELINHENEQLLDSIIAYELLALEDTIKFNRGAMEQEIYSIVSKSRDSTENRLFSFYSRDIVKSSKISMEKMILDLIFEKNVPILKIYD